MKEVFEGDLGLAILKEALRVQVFFDGNFAAIDAAAAQLEILELKKNEILIEENSSGTDLYFILKGAGLQICIDGWPVGAREVGQCVGEMSALEPTELRSATVRAIDTTVVARLPFVAFRKIADDHPATAWRGIAKTIAKRLRERRRFIRPRAAVPKLFIGSSSERLDIAEAISASLAHAPCQTHVWNNGVFRPSYTTIEELAKAIDNFDFALFVLTPDDKLNLRKKNYAATRDNVLFEMGLFIGAMGRERVLALVSDSKKYRRPSDLFGVNLIEYAEAKIATDLPGALGHVGAMVRSRVQTLGPR